jgi:hypothetical protein
MGRRVATAALVVACGGLIVVAMSTTSQAVTGAPTKTSPPPTPSTTTVATVTTVTTVWPSTTTMAAATTTLPSPPTTSSAGATTFDALAFLGDYYAGMASDPFVTSLLADENAVADSPAMSFLHHEAIVAGSIYAHTNDPLPSYTVTAEGPAVSVCRDDGACETFSDFVLADGRLDSFSVDGQSIEQWTSVYDRVTTAETLTIDASFAVRRPGDGLLSVGLLLDSRGGDTAFGWELATYVDATGRSFSIDSAASEFPGSMQAGGLDVAHVSFAGAEHGGQLSIPITSDSGVATAINIPVVVPSGAGARFAPVATAVTTTLAGQPVFEPVGFFTDVFTQVADDPLESGDLPQRVVAGSPAEAFVTYFLGFGAARLDSRQGAVGPWTAAATTTPIEGAEAVEVCDVDNFCDTFSDFVVVDGRLESFRLNGIAIDDRLAAPSKSTTFGPATIRVIGAFERVTVDVLAIVVGLEPQGEAIAMAWDEVAYVDPSGTQIPVDLLASAYPEVVTPRSDGHDQAVVLQFPTADVGGELILPLTSPSSATPVEARVPVEGLRT